MQKLFLPNLFRSREIVRKRFGFSWRTSRWERCFGWRGGSDRYSALFLPHSKIGGRAPQHEILGNPDLGLWDTGDIVDSIHSGCAKRSCSWDNSITKFCNGFCNVTKCFSDFVDFVMFFVMFFIMVFVMLFVKRYKNSSLQNFITKNLHYKIFITKKGVGRLS